MSSDKHHHSPEPAKDRAVDELGGLAVSSGGYTLLAAPLIVEPGHETNLRLCVADSLGNTVRDFETQHERGLHLIVVRRDLAHFQHLHPAFGEDGTWSVSLTLNEAGSYRAFADFFVSGGAGARTLGIDVAAPGVFVPVPARALATVARVAAYDVQLDGGPWKAGTSAELICSVRQHGEPVLDLEPYLGAGGHLVILREGDLAYLHVHALPSEGRTSRIRFRTEFPSAGRYQLFLQFSHRGAVQTAQFAVEVAYARSERDEAMRRADHQHH
jgi:hypothetical protein